MLHAFCKEPPNEALEEARIAEISVYLYSSPEIVVYFTEFSHQQQRGIKNGSALNMSRSITSSASLESIEKAHFRESLLFFLSQEARSLSSSTISSPPQTRIRKPPAAEGLRIVINDEHDHDIEHGMPEEEEEEEDYEPDHGILREETFSMLPTISEISDTVSVHEQKEASISFHQSTKSKRSMGSKKSSAEMNPNATVISFRVDEWQIEARKTTPTSTSGNSPTSRKQSRRDMQGKLSMMSLRDIPLYNVSYDALETPRHGKKKKKNSNSNSKGNDAFEPTLTYQSNNNIPHNTSSYYYCNPKLTPKRSYYKGSPTRKKSRTDVFPTLEKELSKLVPINISMKNDTPSKSFIYEFDYVIVFPIAPNVADGQTTDAKYIMHTMLLAGLELFPYLSTRKDSLFVLIRCPVSIHS